MNNLLCQIQIRLTNWLNTSLQESNDVTRPGVDVTVQDALRAKAGTKLSQVDDRIEIVKKKKVHKWVCTVCDIKCTSEKRLLKHVESHNVSSKSSRVRVNKRLAKQYKEKDTLNCELCGETFEGEELLTLHVREHVRELSNKDVDVGPGTSDLLSTTKSIWTCMVCNQVCTSEENLAKHMTTVHDRAEEQLEDEDNNDGESDEGLNCGECGKTFTSAAGLQNHVRKHREMEELLQCEHCDKKFSALGSLQRHTRTAHEQFFKCAPCNKFVKGKKLLRQHMEKEHADAPKIYKCYNCDQNFDTGEMYTEHKGNCRIKCDLCDKELKGKNGFKKHMIRVHGEAGMCSCTVCGQQFPSISSLKRHESTHNEGQPYQCAICGKTYKTDLILKFHMDEHTGKTFQCTICQKTYKTRQNLKSHIYTHKVRTKTFQCDICGKSLTRAKTLKIHLQIHSDERKFQCKFCGRAFNTLSYMDRHIKCVHENIKRFECNICGKTFSYKHNQQDHMTIHTGERNIECPKCDMKFSTKRSLASHMVNHIETENFHCEICGKAFKTKTYLKNHKANHLNERRFKCVVCGEGFNTSSALVHHRKSHDKLM